MQTDDSGLTAPPRAAPPRAAPVPWQEPDRAAGIARGAALIAGITAVSRMFGLVRTLVFAQSVGAGCMGTAYVTANQVPNLIYELALGGALTSAMVPVLARSAERSGSDPAHRARVAQISSAMLTWTVIILVPLTVIIAALAGPIASLLIPANPNAACARPDMVNVTSNMIVVFAPQILLYGLSVVLFGLLQAYRRFTGPTLAPVIANVVMISSYLAFASLDKGLPLARTPLAAELVLSIGSHDEHRHAGARGPAADVAAAPEIAAHPEVPGGGDAAGRRPGGGRRAGVPGRRRGRRGHHRPRQRPR